MTYRLYTYLYALLVISCPFILGAQTFHNEGASGDFLNYCFLTPTVELSCGVNYIEGSIQGEEQIGHTDPSDYFNIAIPTNSRILSVKMSTSNGMPSHRSFLALWPGVDCSGGTPIYSNIQFSTTNLFSNLTVDHALTLRGIDTSFNYIIELVVDCNSTCITQSCGNCEDWDPNSCSCVAGPEVICAPNCEVLNLSTCECEAVVPMCDLNCEVLNEEFCRCDPKPEVTCTEVCEVYNPATCSCDTKPMPTCDPNCEVFNESLCQCDPKPVITCTDKCEEYNPVICACEPKVFNCDPNCEVFNEDLCQCDLKEIPVCHVSCEVWNEATCSCDPVEAKECDPNCEQYNTTTCNCDPIPTPVCNPDCEVLNEATCSCDPVEQKECDPTCEQYNTTTCSCDPIPTPVCNPDCEVLNEVTCSCDPVEQKECDPNCEQYNTTTCNCDPIPTPICNPDCEVLNEATCSCDPVEQKECDPNCEQYNTTTCSCDPIPTPICNPDCEVLNEATCSCESIDPPSCASDCEIFNPATCSCDPIIPPVCKLGCEEYDEQTCQCVPLETPVCTNPCEVINEENCQCEPIDVPSCDPNCQIYNEATCECEDRIQPVCDPTCEILNELTCSCIPIEVVACDPNCEELISCQCIPIETPTCDPYCEELVDCQCVPKELPICIEQCMEIVDCNCVKIAGCTPTIELCDGIDNDGDGLIDENYSDFDFDGVADCVDGCPYDSFKTSPGICGCGFRGETTDIDGDGVIDCKDACPENPTKQTSAGDCGCHVDLAEEAKDTDRDGITDCVDACPENPYLIESTYCGCDAPQIETVILHNTTACNPSTQTFSADVTIYFSYPPRLGAINISGDLNTTYHFSNAATRRDITLKQQIFAADGKAISLVIVHKGNEGCYFASGNVAIAPTCAPTIFDPNAPIDPPPFMIPGDCGIHFIGIDNATTCNDNQTNFKFSDDYLYADVTVYFTKPPAVGQLELRTPLEGWAAGAHLLWEPGYTFKGVRLPANEKDIPLTAIFKGGTDCTYTQDFEAISLHRNQPCTACKIMGTRIVNLSCEADQVHFDLIATGINLSEGYTLSGVSESKTVSYNSFNSFSAAKSGLANLVIKDNENANCTYTVAINTSTCEVASARTNDSRIGRQAEPVTLSIYPNPAQTELIVQYDLPEIRLDKAIEIAVYDRLGNIRIRQAIDHKGRVLLDISELENGLHFLIVNQGGLIRTGKFIKEDLR